MEIIKSVLSFLLWLGIAIVFFTLVCVVFPLIAVVFGRWKRGKNA
jgi:hypothetical protein